MRLLSYLQDGEERFGSATSEGVNDLTSRMGGEFPNLKALIAAEALPAAQRAVTGQVADHRFDQLTLLPPITSPEKLWCIGVNYNDRNEEYKDNSDLPKYPSLFVRAPSSVVGSGQPLEKPRVS